MSGYYLRLNTIVSGVVLFSGILAIVGGLLYSAHKASHPECYGEDIRIELDGPLSSLSTTVLDRNRLLIGSGDELIVVDTCKNKIIKHIRLVQRQS